MPAQYLAAAALFLMVASGFVFLVGIAARSIYLNSRPAAPVTAAPQARADRPAYYTVRARRRAAAKARVRFH